MTRLYNIIVCDAWSCLGREFHVRKGQLGGGIKHPDVRIDCIPTHCDNLDGMSGNCWYCGKTNSFWWTRERCFSECPFWFKHYCCYKKNPPFIALSFVSAYRNIVCIDMLAKHTRSSYSVVFGMQFEKLLGTGIYILCFYMCMMHNLHVLSIPQFINGRSLASKLIT